MLSRREFVRGAALVAAGVIAADQLEILDRIAPRSLFGGWSPESSLFPELPMMRVYSDTYHWRPGTSLPSVQWRPLDYSFKLKQVRG